MADYIPPGILQIEALDLDDARGEQTVGGMISIVGIQKQLKDARLSQE